MVYGRKSQWSTPFATQLVYVRRELSYARRMAILSEHIVANRIAFFSSHLCAAHLPCFDPARAFTILRDPVERVLSEYTSFSRRAIRRTRSRYSSSAPSTATCSTASSCRWI